MRSGELNTESVLDTRSGRSIATCRGVEGEDSLAGIEFALGKVKVKVNLGKIVKGLKFRVNENFYFRVLN